MMSTRRRRRARHDAAGSRRRGARRTAQVSNSSDAIAQHDGQMMIRHQLAAADPRRAHMSNPEDVAAAKSPRNQAR
jgi:hypothetical protein